MLHWYSKKRHTFCKIRLVSEKTEVSKIITWRTFAQRSWNVADHETSDQRAIIFDKVITRYTLVFILSDSLFSTQQRSYQPQRFKGWGEGLISPLPKPLRGSMQAFVTELIQDRRLWVSFQENYFMRHCLINEGRKVRRKTKNNYCCYSCPFQSSIKLLWNLDVLENLPPESRTS